MRGNMLQSAVYTALLSGLTVGLTACGGGGGDSNSMSPPTSQVSMPLTLSDATS